MTEQSDPNDQSKPRTKEEVMDALLKLMTRCDQTDARIADSEAQENAECQKNMEVAAGNPIIERIAELEAKVSRLEQIERRRTADDTRDRVKEMINLVRTWDGEADTDDPPTE